MPQGAAKSKSKPAPGEHEPIDFLATGFKVTTNCAFSVKILENFKLRSDHLASGETLTKTRNNFFAAVLITIGHLCLAVQQRGARLRSSFTPRHITHELLPDWSGRLRCCGARPLRNSGPKCRHSRPCMTCIIYILLWAEIKADEKGIEDFEGEMLRLKQRKAFLESRIVENKAWAANYDEHFGPFVNKYKEFMEQVGQQLSPLATSAADQQTSVLNALDAFEVLVTQMITSVLVEDFR